MMELKSQSEVIQKRLENDNILLKESAEKGVKELQEQILALNRKVEIEQNEKVQIQVIWIDIYILFFFFC